MPIQANIPIRLFCSYSHKDEHFRSSMEKSLSLLRKKNLLQEWSDHKILPGQRISDAVKKEIEAADILVFLLSFDFIASDACMREWEDSRQLESLDKPRIRIPIILTECPWQELLDDNDIKALPRDGCPIVSYPDRSIAWNEVYEGIKSVVENIRSNFSPKKKFLKRLEETEFVSQNHIKLKDIFVFPPLTYVSPQSNPSNQLLENRISNMEQLLARGTVLLHGDDMSGKTTLLRYLFLTLVQENSPVLFIDLKRTPRYSSENTFRTIYNEQFNGDYHLWRLQQGKTLILDNLTSAPNAIKFVESASATFERIILSAPSDIYRSFFWDDTRLAEFEKVKIEPLSHIVQERLIRKRFELMRPDYTISDGVVDEIEGRVNSIINNRILPRYPFYVLSVIQTFEGFMPRNMSITTHGHCYYVLIISRLIKAGIPNRDEDINVCLNFAERLAFRIYDYEEVRDLDFDQLTFTKFVNEYRESYIIRDSILNRLRHSEYGILTEAGQFRIPYMQYFFLGMYLAKPGQEQKEVTEKICQFSHLPANHLILLFIIHHAVDQEIIDAILLWTMCTIDAVAPAQLNQEETARFQSIVVSLPQDVLSENDVRVEREKERRFRDLGENHTVHLEGEVGDEGGDVEEANNCYRILKNNELLGQILKSRYGRLRRDRIAEMVEIIADSGLRLINAFLGNEEDIAALARYVKQIYPNQNIEQIRETLRFFSFIWTMTNVEAIVASVRHREIRDIVVKVARKKGTPAYDVIEYFSALDSAEELSPALNKRLADLLKRYNDPFIRGVLSIRTQHYINTHSSKATIEQKFCSLLGLQYKHRIKV